MKLENGFEEFWNLYPRRNAKLAACKAFDKAIKKTTIEEIKSGIIKYNNYIKNNKVETQFIKFPATWLNQGCWEDEYETDVIEFKKTKEEKLYGVKSFTYAGDGKS